MGFDQLGADLFGADRRRSAAGQRIEGGTAGGVGICGGTDLAVDPGLTQPGDAGDGADRTASGLPEAPTSEQDGAS